MYGQGVISHFRRTASHVPFSAHSQSCAIFGAQQVSESSLAVPFPVEFALLACSLRGGVRHLRPGLH